MDRMQKLTRSLLVLIQGMSFAAGGINFWLSGGYDFSTQQLTVSPQVIPLINDNIVLMDSVELSLDQSGPFIALEAEQYFSPEYSGSLKAVFYNSDKSLLKPYLNRNSGTILEGYSKYHYNNFTYALGYSLQHDALSFSTPDNSYNYQYSRIKTALALSTEIPVNEYSRISFTSIISTPFSDEADTDSITPKAQYNMRVALAYNLDNLK